MIVEHITLGGNSTKRDSTDIALSTINLLKDFQIRYGSAELPFPRTDFTVKITATEEGAIFDINKGGQIAFTNVCCFGHHQDEMIDYAQSLSKRTILGADIIKRPKRKEFIYTIPVMPFALSPDEIQIAGEIELYIYYSLYLAQRE
jgi:hypothetical protein